MRQTRRFDREAACFVGGALLILAVAALWGYAVWADGNPTSAVAMIMIAGVMAACTCGVQFKRLSARRAQRNGGRN